MTFKKQWYKIPLTSFELRRPNFPLNCFTLDISQHSGIKKEGLKQIFFYFLPIMNTTVEILLEDKRVSCSRPIKENKFYFSGTYIKHELGI